MGVEEMLTMERGFVSRQYIPQGLMVFDEGRGSLAVACSGGGGKKQEGSDTTMGGGMSYCSM